jgi:hypothetical protein
MTLAAVTWTWWIAVPLTIGAIILLLATIVGYVVKVVRPQYEPEK